MNTNLEIKTIISKNIQKDILEMIYNLHTRSLKEDKKLVEKNISFFKKCPNLILNLLIENKDKKSLCYGYTALVPLNLEFFNHIKRCFRRKKRKNKTWNELIMDNPNKFIIKEITKDLIISGNIILYVKMKAVDEYHNEDYIYALPLYYRLEWQFYEMRPSILLFDATSKISKDIIISAGCKKFCSSGKSALYFFDTEIALKHPTSGLGVIFAHNFGMPGIKLLDLSPNEKICGQSLLEGKSLKQIKSSKSYHNWNRIYHSLLRKIGKAMGLEESPHEYAVLYLSMHRYELYPSFPTNYPSISDLKCSKCK